MLKAENTQQRVKEGKKENLVNETSGALLPI